MDDDAPPGVPEWVVTYGDMMSLLLTFFIMLVSMSQMKEEGRVQTMLDSLTQAFGADDVLDSGVPGKSFQKNSQYPVKSSKGTKSEGGTLKASQDSAGTRGAADPVQRIREGRRVTLGGPAMFAPFSAEPGPEFAGTLDTLADVIDSSRRQLAVRGHTSPVPLPTGSPYRDHDELAYRRAQSVAEALEARGIPSERLVLSSAGAREPKLRTRDRNEQRLNDRVDVFLVDAFTTEP